MARKRRAVGQPSKLGECSPGDVAEVQAGSVRITGQFGPRDKAPRLTLVRPAAGGEPFFLSAETPVFEWTAGRPVYSRWLSSGSGPADVDPLGS